MSNPPADRRGVVLNVRQLVQESLAQGMTPRLIRLKLANLGVHWQYAYTGSERHAYPEGPGTDRPQLGIPEVRRKSHQGRRERDRRLRQGRLCLSGCGNQYEPGSTTRLCSDCLAAKWAPLSVDPPIRG